MSAKFQFGILNTFDHNVGTWKTYIGRIKQYFVANDIDTKTDAAGRKRKAILLSALTEETYKLASDLALPKDIEDVPYEDLISLLDTHFTPKSIGFGERHNFYAATQKEEETYSQWAARLRGLTAKCGFLNVEEAIRDKFIMGMLSGPEKEKLYAKDITDLTLAKVVEMAENMHRARAAVTVSAPTDVTTVRNQIFKISNSKNNSVRGTNVRCGVCGYSNHKSTECKFANYVCKKCHVKGHLRKVCKKNNYVNVDCSDKDDDGEDDGKFYYIRSLRGEPMVETVVINGNPYKFEVDSGSAVTVIAEGFYKSKFKSVPLSATNKQLMTYNGKKIVCIGTLYLPVCYAGQKHGITLYVVRDGGPPLLGRDFISMFNLQLVPVNYCGGSELSIRDLQRQYSKLFSDNLGTFNKYKIKLSLKSGVVPVYCKPRPVAFALRDKVNKEIDRLVDLGILEPVEYSEYASPIVPILKKDGSVRLCVDFSISINKQLLIEKYPLPTINELFSKIHGAQLFSKLDLSMAYNQFLLDDESKNLTSINTSRGLYRFTRLVFGLASAPSIFQRAIEGVLAGLDGVLCLLDDILVTGRDRQEHLKLLNVVMQRLQDAGLTLQKEKCSFFQDEVSYLGYIITKDGLKKAPEKIKAMTEAPTPTNVNQLQSFLGLINYYRNFVPNASTILSPLYELLKKGCKWSWTEVHEKAFRAIKKLMASEKVLAHYDPKAKLILTVDASPSGLGAILSQIGRDSIERPISFMSRSLNPAEKRYAQIQREATAIIYGVRRFHQYLYGRSEPFILRTDHKPLLSIFGPHKGIPEMSANRLQRYALFLSSYNYTIEYVRSADNSADFLSRSSLPRATHECACTEQCRCCDCEVAYDRATYVCFVVDGSMPVTLDVLRKETKNDTVLKLVVDFIINGWPPKVSDLRLKRYHLCRTQLSYENGCVMRGHKVVIPENLRQTILKELHTSHLGIVKTKAEARSRFWFPGIDEAVETMIGSCDICIQLRPSPPRAPIAHWKYPSVPFHRIHIDYLGPIKGCVYLVIVDAYTKWVEVYNMNTATSTAAVISKLYDCMARFGVPATIVSDNGTAFCSREFDLFCATNGITHLTSPVYHAPSNGQAESLVKVVKKAIKSCLLSSNSCKEVSIKLLKHLMDYRNSVHTTTGVSPAEMMFGHKLRSRLDLIDPKPPSYSSPSLSAYVKKQQCLQSKREKVKKRSFKEKDIVLFKKFHSNNKHTWGAAVVQKRVGKVLYIVKEIGSTQLFKRHVNQLMIYRGNSNNPLDLEQNTSTRMSDTRPPRAMRSRCPSLSPASSRAPSPLPVPAADTSALPMVCNAPTCDAIEAPIISQSKGSGDGLSGSTSKGRREEIYIPSTSPPSEEEYDEDEFLEAETEAPETTKEPDSGDLIESSKRLLRTRPPPCFKKYF